MPEHKDITDPNIHETKGAAAASAGQVLIATGAGTATFQNSPYTTLKAGWWDYNDLATQSAPISLLVAGTQYDMTNDGLGPNTMTGFATPNGTHIWNTSTNRLNFTNLAIGDTCEIRVDFSVTTGAANTAIDVDIEFAVGQPGAFSLPIFNPINVKVASTIQAVRAQGFYIGSALVRDNPARIRMRADSAGSTVKVNGWYIRALRL